MLDQGRRVLKTLDSLLASRGAESSVGLRIHCLGTHCTSEGNRDSCAESSVSLRIHCLGTHCTSEGNRDSYRDQPFSSASTTLDATEYADSTAIPSPE